MENVAILKVNKLGKEKKPGLKLRINWKIGQENTK